MATPALPINERPVPPVPPQAIQPQGGPLPPSVFKDEGKDVTGDALARNELRMTGAEEPAVPISAPPEPAAPPPPAPEGEKLLAGKYKSVEELEKGYMESQKGFMAKVEAEAAKKAEELAAKRANEILVEKFRSLVQTDNAAQAVAQNVERSLEQLSADEHIDLLTKDPVRYQRMVKDEARKEILGAIQAANLEQSWRAENKDILEMEVIPAAGEQKPVTGEMLVSSLILTLAQRDPSKRNDPSALLTEATGHVRNLVGTLVNRGKQEAMTVRETVAPLQATAATPAAGDNRSAQLSAPRVVDPVEDEIQRQRAEQRRITGGQPVVRW